MRSRPVATMIGKRSDRSGYPGHPGHPAPQPVATVQRSIRSPVAPGDHRITLSACRPPLSPLPTLDPAAADPSTALGMTARCARSALRRHRSGRRSSRRRSRCSCSRGPGRGRRSASSSGSASSSSSSRSTRRRICAFTFTNKAAGEIAERLARTLGAARGGVKTGTIHSFCAELLREFGARVGLERGFGILDDKAQHAVLRRIGRVQLVNGVDRCAASRRTGSAASRSRIATTSRRSRSTSASSRDRNFADFDTLILKTAELLTHDDVVQRVRARWDCVLVDEFQDLNPLQYSGHPRAGARPSAHLRRRRRRAVDLLLGGRRPDASSSRTRTTSTSAADHAARESPLLARDPRARAEADRAQPDAVRRAEAARGGARVGVLRRRARVRGRRGRARVARRRRAARPRRRTASAWGDVALLYRTHDIGDELEAAFLAAGIPVPARERPRARRGPDHRLRRSPRSRWSRVRTTCTTTRSSSVALPKQLVDDARARLPAQRRARCARSWRRWRASSDAEHADARRIRRACYSLDNLPALGAAAHDA